MGTSQRVQPAYYRVKLSYEINSWNLFESLNAGEAVAVVDGRSREAFATEHIPGAVSLPHRWRGGPAGQEITVWVLSRRRSDWTGARNEPKASAAAMLLQA